MNAAEKNARRQRAEHLREAAVRLARSQPIGIVDIAGVQMRVYEFRRGDLTIEYLMPRFASAKLSRLTVRAAGEKVLDCEFDDRQMSRFQYIAGGWERSLLT